MWLPGLRSTKSSWENLITINEFRRSTLGPQSIQTKNIRCFPKYAELGEGLGVGRPRSAQSCQIHLYICLNSVSICMSRENNSFISLFCIVVIFSFSFFFFLHLVHRIIYLRFEWVLQMLWFII